jgi:hypothetical protein
MGIPDYHSYTHFRNGNFEEGYTNPVDDLLVKVDGKKNGICSCEITVQNIHYAPSYHYNPISAALSYVILHELKHIEMASIYVRWAAAAQSRRKTCRYFAITDDAFCKNQASLVARRIRNYINDASDHTSRLFDFVERKYNPWRDLQILEEQSNRIIHLDVMYETSKEPEDWECHDTTKDF